MINLNESPPLLSNNSLSGHKSDAMKSKTPVRAETYNFNAFITPRDEYKDHLNDMAIEKQD